MIPRGEATGTPRARATCRGCVQHAGGAQPASPCMRAEGAVAHRVERGGIGDALRRDHLRLGVVWQVLVLLHACLEVPREPKAAQLLGRLGRLGAHRRRQLVQQRVHLRREGTHRTPAARRRHTLSARVASPSPHASTVPHLHPSGPSSPACPSAPACPARPSLASFGAQPAARTPQGLSRERATPARHRMRRTRTGAMRTRRIPMRGACRPPRVCLRAAALGTPPPPRQHPPHRGTSPRAWPPTAAAPTPAGRPLGRCWCSPASRARPIPRSSRLHRPPLGTHCGVSHCPPRRRWLLWQC